MYCATPAHKNRMSRHFDVMMLAITPRWVLQEFNKTPSYARRIKAQVRERLAKYDSISIHPDLNTYGAEDNFEWRQYFSVMMTRPYLNARIIGCLNFLVLIIKSAGCWFLRFTVDSTD